MVPVANVLWRAFSCANAFVRFAVLRRARFVSFSAVITFLTSSTTPITATTATPTPAPIGVKPHASGLFLLQGGRLRNVEALDLPYVEGVRIRADWRDIEPTEGNRIWTDIDQAVAIAHSKGKICGLAVDAGIYCPIDWLTAAGCKFYTLQDTSGNQGEKIPVPGDPVFLAKWKNFIKAFAARYDSNPDVRYVLSRIQLSVERWQSRLALALRLIRGRWSTTSATMPWRTMAASSNTLLAVSIRIPQPTMFQLTR